jgi:hypothetical protein
MHFGLLASGLTSQGIATRQCGRALFLECLSVDELAFQAAVIVDARTRAGELL